MQRYFSKKKIDDYFELSSDDLRHIKLVMRMKDNDLIEVVYDEDVYLSCIENVNQNIKIKCIKKQEKDENKLKKITLIIPVLKEQKMDLILQKATELGVCSIQPVIMERSIIRVDDSNSIKKVERWNKICKEASEQSKRYDIPLVFPIMKLKNMKKLPGLSLICSTTEKENNIKKFLHDDDNYDRINIVIGPEGGLTSKEEELLVNIGFKKMTLGSRILRVETVPIFLLSVINYECME